MMPLAFGMPGGYEFLVVAFVALLIFGNRLPGVPQNQIKFGVQYGVTDRWRSGQFLFGDEPNLNPKLPSYVTLNLNTSYQVTDHFQIFGLVQNVTDARYYTYGTFSPVSSVALARSSMRGTPMWLLRLPSVFSTWNRWPKTAAVKSFVLVLPLLPVIATTRRGSWFR